MNRLTLEFLDGHSADATVLARLHAHEWRHLYRKWDVQRVLAEFRAQKNDDSLPATLVLRRNGLLIGSVSVAFDDCEARRDINPWLASLYVLPGERGRGYGDRLVGAAIDLARRNKVGRLYVFTESADKLFQRHGFVRFAEAAPNGHAVTIFRRDI